MWHRQIHFVPDVSAAATPHELAHRGRLRVVDDDEVVLAVERERVVDHPLEVDALHRGVPLDIGALQRVVHRLGDAEELVAAVDDLPVDFEAGVSRERDVGREQLGDATAVGGRVDVQDPGSVQRRRELTDAFNGPGLDDRLVVVEVLVE